MITMFCSSGSALHEWALMGAPRTCKDKAQNPVDEVNAILGQTLVSMCRG
jgi:hypothetical protein